MRKLRWAMDGGGFWELDVETPTSMEGTARPVPGFPLPLPLGLSRGPRLSRPNQLDFIHRFMATPLVPSHHPDRGVSLDHVFTYHSHPNLTGFLMGRVLVRKAAAAFKEGRASGLSWAWTVAQKLWGGTPFGLGVELLLTPDSSLAVETFMDDDKMVHREKALLSHKFPHHDLTVEAAWPGLFVDNSGTYWDVPSVVTLDVASHASDSGLSYHLCLQNISGEATTVSNEKIDKIPATLLPGLSAKAAFSFRKNFDFWRKKDGKLKLLQPYDVFLSDPHFSASTTIDCILHCDESLSLHQGSCQAAYKGSVVGAWIGDESSKARLKTELQQSKSAFLDDKGNNAYLSADLFGSITLTAQHGNFQRLFFDLTRLSTWFEFPSGSSLVRGTTGALHDIRSSRPPSMEALGAVCPKVTVSLQQQLVGPVSFRVESHLGFNTESKGKGLMQVGDTIFAVEYAMEVLGSARATAWYSQKNREAMVELRFFES